MFFVVNQVFTVKDREEVESVAPTPDIIEEYYTPPDIEKVAHYKMQLEQLLRKVRCLAECLCLFYYTWVH